MKSVSFLLDSNIITYWVMSNKVLTTVSKELMLPKDMVRLYNDRYSSSSKLVDKIINGELKSNYRFYIYDFNVFETTAAIRNEIKSSYYFVHGVPMSKWSDRGGEMQVNEELLSKIYHSFYEALDSLLHRGKLKLLAVPFSGNGDSFGDHLDAFLNIIFWASSIQTQDAILLSAYYVDGIDYFVTEDDRLKRLSQSLSSLNKNTKHMFQIISPGDPIFSKVR